jgi:hypothetical protein
MNKIRSEDLILIVGMICATIITVIWMAWMYLMEMVKCGVTP